MTDKEIAAALLQLLDSATFPGSARGKVNAIAAWLDEMKSGNRKTTILPGMDEKAFEPSA